EEPQRPLDLALGADVDRGGGLVEDQDPGIGEKRTCQRDELPLAERKTRTTFVELCFVAVLEAQDEIVRANGLRGLHHLFARGIGAPEGDVLRDVAGEEETFLRDDAELLA